MSYPVVFMPSIQHTGTNQMINYVFKYYTKLPVGGRTAEDILKKIEEIEGPLLVYGHTWDPNYEVWACILMARPDIPVIAPMRHPLRSLGSAIGRHEEDWRWFMWWMTAWQNLKDMHYNVVKNGIQFVHIDRPDLRDENVKTINKRWPHLNIPKQKWPVGTRKSNAQVGTYKMTLDDLSHLRVYIPYEILRFHDKIVHEKP